MLERHRDTTSRAQHSQAVQLEVHADRFAALLAQGGYARVTVREKLQLLGDLSRWLKRCKLQATDLDEQRIRSFLRYRARRHCRRRGDAATSSLDFHGPYLT
jgi:hypothetical protein